MAIPSSPLHPPSMTNGPSRQFQALSWAAFVQLVLEITVHAYQKMRRDKVARQEWPEDTFTAKLTEDYIQPLAQQHSLNLVAVAQAPVYSAAIKNGQISPLKASKIDIKLFIGTWDYSRVYFAWECKKICDKSFNKEYGNFTSQYVTEGMLRFLDEIYAPDVRDAGMLAYVLGGTVSNIVADINASLEHPRRTRKLLSSDYLSPASSIATFSDVYRSHHTRFKSQTSLCLHHLFLSFDFVSE